jgi:PAS domain S-box-containing protein
MPGVMGSGWNPPSDGHSRRWLMLAVAAILFAGVFFLRLEVENPGQIVTLLYALPIALVAVELGMGWGLAVAALALGMFGLWDLAWAGDGGHNALDYLSRGGAFFILGGAVGALADRVRKVSADSARYWELSNDLLCTARFDGRFERLNPAWERTLGWTLDELRSRPFVEFVHPEDRERTEAETASLTGAGHETINFENRYRCKDGSYRTLLWSATAAPDEGRIHAIARDGTDARRAEDDLRRSEQFLDSVLENLPSMVFVKDAEELRFVRLNRAGEELLGCSREELIGKNDHDVFAEREADSFVQKDREVLASGEVVDVPEEPIDTRENGSRVLHTRKIAIRDERGEPRYLLGISEDITDRKLAERAAEAARAEVERANEAKSEFLSRMSHELRTPLNSVLGFAELLWMDGVAGEQRDFVGQIRRSGRHLLELINEVLDLSRIEAGQMSISPEPVQLRAAVVEAVEMIAPEAASRGIAIEPEYGAACDRYVRADQQRLKQVLLNLLSNAVKYNRPGGSVRICCSHGDGGAPSVTVADTGHGIPEDRLDRLFNPFDRLGAEHGQEGGTGLGLALSKRLVELMDGRLWAESEVGSGTTFWLELVLAEPPDLALAGHSSHADLVAEPSDSDLTLLYIEDNVSNFELIKSALARLGEPSLLSAMQGRLGIDLAIQHLPDVVLLDLHLPDMHGKDVLAELKSDPRTRSIPIIVLSADATRRQVTRLLDAGAYAYLTKPVDLPRFLETVQRATGERKACG